MRSSVEPGDIQDLSRFETSSKDVIIAMGVFCYLNEDEEDRALKEIHRVLKEDGVFICQNVNGLFDAFTFNRFTVNFFEKNIASAFFPEDQLPKISDNFEAL